VYYNIPSNDLTPPFADCIRCAEAPGVDDLGYCGHCHWAARAEVEAGLSLLADYLLKWRRYVDWCDEHGLAA
jgi:hypothetical protein